MQRILRQIELLQCPVFPEPEQPLDYVVNAFRIPRPLDGIDGPGQPGDDDLLIAMTSQSSGRAYPNSTHGNPAT